MASRVNEEDRECNWDEPLPSSSTSEGEAEEELSDEIQRREDLANLDVYVARMAYIPIPPPPPPRHIKRTEGLAKPRRFLIADTYKLFADSMEPPERSQRMKALAQNFQCVSPETFEDFVKAEKASKRKKINIAKRKQEVYYELLSKLERQCRSQYLNVLIKKFADFIAKMATTMNIPQQLNEPYARMQRSIFCNIIGVVGIQPPTEAAYQYNTPDALPYETIHKAAHAFLCLIVKAVDTAALKNLDDIPSPIDKDLEMDSYIKERLMAAAMKKLQQTAQKKPISCLEKAFTKCDKFSKYDPCTEL